MPELPEVETTLQGIRPHLLGSRIRLAVRERRLRWPIDPHLEDKVRGRAVTAMRRRGKYLIVELDRGALLMHLGMSGSFRALAKGAAERQRYWHDHYDLISSSGYIIRYRDPRRFGCLLWCAGDPMQHPRIRVLGVEPLTPCFNGAYLRHAAAGRRLAIKNFIMNSHIVVGVGNIYASEALFAAGIHPLRGCHRLAGARYQRLAESIQTILHAAILSGGSTIRDFSGADGKPGYFEQQLMVYGRQGTPCRHCRQPIRNIVISQRSTFYCARCQR